MGGFQLTVYHNIETIEESKGRFDAASFEDEATRLLPFITARPDGMRQHAAGVYRANLPTVPFKREFVKTACRIKEILVEIFNSI